MLCLGGLACRVGPEVRRRVVAETVEFLCLLIFLREVEHFGDLHLHAEGQGPRAAVAEELTLSIERTVLEVSNSRLNIS